MVNKNANIDHNHIIKEINILVDSRSSNYGDEYEIDLNENFIIAEKNQQIRMNLTYFNMYNNLHGINFRNGNFTAVITTASSTITLQSSLTYQNYYSIHEIASDFAVKCGLLCESVVTPKRFVVKDIKNTVLNRFVPFAVTGGIDSTPGRASHDGNNMLDIYLETTDGSAHNISNINITFADSDLYLILGGIKTPENGTSLQVTITTNNINIKGYFPMQRFSDNNIYLRCDVIGNSFSSPISINGNNTEIKSIHYSSDILGIFNTDSEVIEYINNNNIFSADVKNKYFKTFKLFLTDSRNRRLVTPTPNGTAAGLQNVTGNDGATSNIFVKTQNTQGNLSFKALLNIQLIQLAR